MCWAFSSFGWCCPCLRWVPYWHVKLPVKGISAKPLSWKSSPSSFGIVWLGVCLLAHKNTFTLGFPAVFLLCEGILLKTEHISENPVLALHGLEKQGDLMSANWENISCLDSDYLDFCFLFILSVMNQRYKARLSFDRSLFFFLTQYFYFFILKRL